MRYDGKVAKTTDMKAYFETNTSAYTHVNYHQTPGKMRLTEDRIRSFWYTYCDQVNKNNTTLYLGERIQMQSPIIVNLSFVFDHELEDFDTELWRMILEIISEFQTKIFELIKIPTGNEGNVNYMAVVVLAPDKPILKKGQAAYQYRLHFPYCRIPVKFQHSTLFYEVIKSLRKNNIYSKVSSSLIVDLSEVITYPVETVPMYGSCEDSRSPKLTHRATYDNISDLDLENPDVNVDERLIEHLEDIFDPTCHDHYQKGLITDDMHFDDHNRQFWLPMFLSLHYYNKIMLPKEDVSNTVKPTPTLDMNMQSTEEQTILENLIPHIPKERFKEENVWMDVGRALHYVYKGGNRGKIHWQDITTQYTDFEPSECDLKYDRFNKFPMITHRTIAYMIHKEHPEEYDNWHIRWIQPVLDEIFRDPRRFTHVDIAKLVYRVYWLIFAYEENNWFMYDNHGWTKFKSDKSTFLQKKIVVEFIPWLQSLRNGYITRQRDILDEKDRDSIETMIEAITNLIKDIKKKTLLNPVVDMCHIFFHIEGFIEQLDINPKLMRTMNGVIDLNKKEAVFRNGKPEDYLTLQTTSRYNQSLNWKHPIVKKFMKWMKQMFYYDSTINFFLKLNASYLHGGNINKYFIVYSGSSGNNAKSTICSTMKKALGMYHVEIPTSVLTGKRGQSGSAAPELARLGFARVGTAKETDGDDKLQLGQIKEMTGNDAFFARFLHDNGRDIEPQFKLILQCNDVPSFNQTDNAIKNRTLNIPFLSVWTKDAPDTEEEQMKVRRFKMDPLFKDHIVDYAEAYLWVIVQYYKNYCTEGLDMPKEIEDYTNEYWESIDLLKQFIDSELIKETHPSKIDQVCISQKDLFTAYKDYMDELHPGKRKEDSSKFFDEMDKRLGMRKEHRYFGWRLPTEAFIGNQ